MDGGRRKGGWKHIYLVWQARSARREKMEKILHRVNTLKALEGTKKEYGTEVDLRANGGRLIMNHEAFEDGEEFAPFCRAYRHGTMILNPKEDGLEGRCVELLRDNGIRKYFFLDLPMPTMIKLAKGGEHKLAVRFSEYEPVEAVLAMEGMADWVWVDCFAGFTLTEGIVGKFEGKFRICIVSPELQKRQKGEIAVFKEKLKAIGVKIDAVCTDCPELW